MFDPSLSTLTKAWLTTMFAASLLLAALAVTRICADDTPLQSLRRTVQFTGEHPSPDIEGWDGADSADADADYAARAGHTGS
ncbi:MAG TPA: hypothetical protein VL985_07965 [Stellaceae bacterium]|nr:hypothetical protein [Stellaceae bacterium]